MTFSLSPNCRPVFAAALMVVSVFITHAQQQVQRCHTDEKFQQLLLAHPELAQVRQNTMAQAHQYMDQHGHSRSTQATVVIPVVVHVMHNGEAVGTGKNISDAQILSQIPILNADYNKLNSDTGLVPAIFKSRAASTGITFQMATVDPQGNATNGIDRINVGTVTTFDDGMKDSTSWDHNNYLNIWVGNISGGLLGYTTFPNSGRATQDGVVIGYKYYGKGGVTSSPFNLGRTATHEIGHFFGLEHTFEGGCTGNTATTCATRGDGLCDTPPVSAANYGSNLTIATNSCTETPTDEPDMWMNYMDYVDDRAMYMFSKDQADLMNAVLQQQRPGLVTSTAALQQNFFSYNGQVVDSVTGQGVPFAKVLFDGGANKIELTTDSSGNFSTPHFREGTYDIYAAKWGFGTTRYATAIPIDSTTTTFAIGIQPGRYYDDFIIDQGWTVSTTATSGGWVKGAPVATNYNGAAANPGTDASTTDFGDQAYVTGNGGGQAGNDDIDDGVTTLISPSFDLSTFGVPILSYSRWFYNGGGQGGVALNDTLTISLTNGTDTVVLEKVSAADSANTWTERTYHLTDVISLSANMHLLVSAEDITPGNIVEAGLDMFKVYDSTARTGINTLENNLQVQLWPNPTHGMFTLALGNVTDSKVALTVYNTAGHQVQQQELNATNNMHVTLDLTTNAPGIYLVKIQTQSGVITRRVVKL